MEDKMSMQSNAVLMRLSIGLPSQERMDKRTTDEVKSTKGLGDKSGRWVKELWPEVALDCIKKLDTAARSYHDRVTLPFDTGIGILPTAIMLEYGEKMRVFKAQRDLLVEDHFLARWDEWLAWAQAEHNGTFDPGQYDKEKARSSFAFRLDPLPVPSSAHFENKVTQILGLETTASVDKRVAYAEQEAKRELFRRMVEPVAHMVKVLSKDNPRVFDTLTGNIQEIADLASKLNLDGDPVINAFAVELRKLAVISPDTLRKSSTVRTNKKTEAQALLDRLSGYKI